MITPQRSSVFTGDQSQGLCQPPANVSSGQTSADVVAVLRRLVGAVANGFPSAGSNKHWTEKQAASTTTPGIPFLLRKAVRWRVPDHAR